MTIHQAGDLLLDKYRVTHLELKVERAIKVLKGGPSDVGSTAWDDARQRFEMEAQLGARLNSPTAHPNLLQVYNFHAEKDLLVLEMENAPGGSLAERVACARKDKHSTYPHRRSGSNWGRCGSRGIQYRDDHFGCDLRAQPDRQGMFGNGLQTGIRQDILHPPLMRIHKDRQVEGEKGYEVAHGSMEWAGFGQLFVQAGIQLMTFIRWASAAPWMRSHSL